MSPFRIYRLYRIYCTLRHMLHITGHRGAMGLAPENTVESVQIALDCGVNEIEIDVRVTADGVVVANHDAEIQGLKGKLMISKTSHEELLLNKPNLASLSEIIRTINRQVPLQIEVKKGEPTAPVIENVQEFLAQGWQAHDDFLVGSKSQRTLRQLRNGLPRTPLVVIEPYLSVVAVRRCRKLDTKRISMNQKGLWSGFLRSMSRRGYAIHAYALNDVKKAHKWEAAGLRGAITDRPDLFQTQSAVGAAANSTAPGAA